MASNARYEHEFQVFFCLVLMIDMIDCFGFHLAFFALTLHSILGSNLDSGDYDKVGHLI
jgi:hypothetical protein